jgi:hypothetical protein
MRFRTAAPLFQKLCHERAALQPQLCEKDGEGEAFKNTKRRPRDQSPARPSQTNSGVAVRSIAFTTRVEVGLTDFSAHGTLSRSLVATASSSSIWN